MGVFVVIGILSVGVIQLILGFMGLEHLLGLWASFLGVALVFTLRIFLPMTIGAWFGAVEVLGWPWWAGVLVVAPGLLFIAPAMVNALLFKVRGQNF